MNRIAYMLSLLLVFTIPWENAVTIGDWGTLTRAIGAAAAACWILSALLSRRIRRPHLFHVLLFLFLLWNLASLFWSASVDDTIQRILTYIQLAALVWILWDLYGTPAAFRSALVAYILGAYVSLGSLVRNYITGTELGEFAAGRYTGAGMNAVELAVILALGLPIAWHLATTESGGPRSRIVTNLCYMYIPLSVFGILLTGARTGLFVIVPGVLYIVASSNRLGRSARALVFVVLAVGMGAAIIRLPSETIARLATVEDSIAAGDLGGRVRLLKRSVSIFLDHPLLGVGAGAMRQPYLLGSFTHNTFISVLSELGLVGFLLFGAILWVVTREALKQPKWVSRLWLAVLAVWLIGNLTLTWEYTKQTWFFLSFVVVSANVYREQLAQRVITQVAPGLLPDRRFQARRVVQDHLLRDRG